MRRRIRRAFRIVAVIAGADLMTFAALMTLGGESHAVTLVGRNGIEILSTPRDPLMKQQKIVDPADSMGVGSFGTSVALSSHGSKALIGGGPFYRETDNPGAAWVFKRVGGRWAEQQKIAPHDNTGQSQFDCFGCSAALSSNGDTALIGDDYDNTGVGAVWVYTSSGGTWREQAKVSPPDHIGTSAFGFSVALSGDGDTALIGGSEDSGTRARGHGVGAVWVYTRSGGHWIEQQKITPPDHIGNSGFGFSVAMSWDGRTAVIGGPRDDFYVGAAWVYKLSGGRWREVQKLAPHDNAGHSEFGFSVALSATGTTAAIGGVADHRVGAVWVYTRPGGRWTEQQKVTPHDNTGHSHFGSSVALTSDGREALVGGQFDNNLQGTEWVYTRSGSQWTEQQKLSPHNDTYGQFGYRTAASSDGATVLIGAPHYDYNHVSRSGAVWFYTAT